MYEVDCKRVQIFPLSVCMLFVVWLQRPSHQKVNFYFSTLWIWAWLCKFFGYWDDLSRGLKSTGILELTFLLLRTLTTIYEWSQALPLDEETHGWVFTISQLMLDQVLDRCEVISVSAEPLAITTEISWACPGQKNCPANPKSHEK